MSNLSGSLTLTIVNQVDISADLEAGAALTGTLDFTSGFLPNLAGSASLSATLSVNYSIKVIIPSSDPSPISADLSGSAELTADATVGNASITKDPPLIGAVTSGSPAAQAAGPNPTDADNTWHSFLFKVPGKDILKKVRNALETLLTYLEVIKAVLETIKKFLIDFGNPIRALIEAIMRLLNQLFELLKRTGLFAYYDVPNPLKDPNFFKHLNGYAPFTTRFKGSLLDIKDPNRPQPVSGATKAGFVLFVVDATDAILLARKIKQLLRFFGKDFTAPHYAPPANFKAFPVGDKGDPILALARVFADQPKAIALEWSAPTNQQPPDPGFSDLVSALGTEFIPPKFLIERSTQPVNGKLDSDFINAEGAAGTVFHTYTTNFEKRGKPGQRLKRTVKITDEYGDPFIRFETYKIIDISSGTASFLLGQLGKFRFIDTNVEFDNTYFYRVRAFSGDLDIDEPKGIINFVAPGKDAVNRDKNTNTFLVKWPGTDPNSPPTMGRASPIARVRLSKFPPNFDVVEVLRRLFQTAFSLNFHLPLPTPFDPSLVPIGRGSLTKQASSIASFIVDNAPFIGVPAPDPITGNFQEFPWQNARVRRQSARLANTVASALLESGSTSIVQFQQIMQGALPAGQPAATDLSDSHTIEAICRKMTDVVDNKANGEELQQATRIFNVSFLDPIFRKNVLAAIEFILSLTLGGVPPDWVKISILRDIIPWSGQFLYDLLAKMQALLDAFAGIIQEIKDFIDLLIRKIDTLERFIQYLIALLDFIESLAVGAFVLSFETGGGVSDVFQAVDNAGGTPPNPAPNGYQAGIALAYVFPDIAPISAAIKAIF